ncbi:MAG TPA: hypothetical protein VD837_07000 [Terriglobales bacterium]|nr:hypothetical protein [Terriglobales bacterium]
MKKLFTICGLLLCVAVHAATTNLPGIRNPVGVTPTTNAPSGGSPPSPPVSQAKSLLVNPDGSVSDPWGNFFNVNLGAMRQALGPTPMPYGVVSVGGTNYAHIDAAGLVASRLPIQLGPGIFHVTNSGHLVAGVIGSGLKSKIVFWGDTNNVPLTAGAAFIATNGAVFRDCEFSFGYGPDHTNYQAAVVLLAQGGVLFDNWISTNANTDVVLVGPNAHGSVLRINNSIWRSRWDTANSLAHFTSIYARNSDFISVGPNSIAGSQGSAHNWLFQGSSNYVDAVACRFIAANTNAYNVRTVTGTVGHTNFFTFCSFSLTNFGSASATNVAMPGNAGGPSLVRLINCDMPLGGVVKVGTGSAANVRIVTTSGSSDFIATPTNYVAADFIPTPGMVKLVPSNNWMFSVSATLTNAAFQIAP